MIKSLEQIKREEFYNKMKDYIFNAFLLFIFTLYTYLTYIDPPTWP